MWTPSPIDLSAFSDSRFAQLLRSGFWSLRFAGDLERQFDEFHLRRIRSRVRVFFMLLPVMEIYRVIDGLLTGVEDVISLWLIADVLFMAAGARVLWSRWYWRAYLPGATALAAIFLSIAAYSIPVDYIDSSELQTLKFAINVPLMTYLLFGLPFFRATAITVLSAAIYTWSALHTDVPTTELISAVSGVLLASAVAVVLAYTTERSSRTYFLHD